MINQEFVNRAWSEHQLIYEVSVFLMFLCIVGILCGIYLLIKYKRSGKWKD